MKIHDLDPDIILKANINCCDACPRKQEIYLTEISGVYTIVTDPKKSLVTVRGKVDPTMVLKIIAKMGYSAELLSYQKELKSGDDGRWSENEKEHVQRRTEREKREHGCLERHNHHPRMEEYDHEVEDYVPPELDPDICRDPFCKNHRRRPIITNHVPPWDNADHPHHLHGFPCHHGNTFDCYHPRMPPAEYCLRLRRPVHGSYNFTYLGDAYARERRNIT